MNEKCVITLMTQSDVLASKFFQTFETKWKNNGLFSNHVFFKGNGFQSDLTPIDKILELLF